jgi:hypothetical protein
MLRSRGILAFQSNSGQPVGKAIKFAAKGEAAVLVEIEAETGIAAVLLF